MLSDSRPICSECLLDASQFFHEHWGAACPDLSDLTNEKGQGPDLHGLLITISQMITEYSCDKHIMMAVILKNGPG